MNVMNANVEPIVHFNDCRCRYNPRSEHIRLKQSRPQIKLIFILIQKFSIFQINLLMCKTIIECIL